MQLPKLSSFYDENNQSNPNPPVDPNVQTPVQDPAGQAPVVPIVQQPIVQQPVVQQPIVQQPIVQQPVEPVAQQPDQTVQMQAPASQFSDNGEDEQSIEVNEKKQIKSDLNIVEMLGEVVSRNASDLHVTAGYKPYIRVDGKLFPFIDYVLKSEEIKDLLTPVLGDSNLEILEVNKEVDFSYAYKNVARFRINVFYQQGAISAAFRLIPNQIRSVEELYLPPILHDFTRLPQGLILVTGPTGSGKSTTLAGMIQEINERDALHIVTIEDPIEYVYPKSNSIIDQREIHQDTHSWEIALRSVLRQDPNVVLVGEMRDYETIAAALTVAETGHLVFATLHTNSASRSVDRIIHVFPAHQQAQVRIMLANVISAVISQRLIPTIGGGRRAVLEVLVGTPAVSNLIREGKDYQIDNVIQTSADLGMIPLEKSLVSLVREGRITVEDAQRHTTKPEEVLRLLGQN